MGALTSCHQGPCLDCTEITIIIIFPPSLITLPASADLMVRNPDISFPYMVSSQLA
jgi:hypothetical protein